MWWMNASKRDHSFIRPENGYDWDFNAIKPHHAECDNRILCKSPTAKEENAKKERKKNMLSNDRNRAEAHARLRKKGKRECTFISINRSGSWPHEHTNNRNKQSTNKARTKRNHWALSKWAMRPKSWNKFSIYDFASQRYSHGEFLHLLSNSTEWAGYLIVSFALSFL